MAIFFRKITAPFAGAIHWVFAEDIDATYNELKSAGANIVDPLEKKPWGLRQFTVEDIDGNRFYFTTTNQAPGNFRRGTPIACSQRRSFAARAECSWQLHRSDKVLEAVSWDEPIMNLLFATHQWHCERIAEGQIDSV